ncbi:MAG: hypothetical protein R3219_06330, partial [Hydrogenovibrio sp.]|nr:hypothetical protein [Hydrogenovibrio sp.]
EPETLNALLHWAGASEFALTDEFDLSHHRETQLNQLADAIEQHLDMEAVINLLSPRLADFSS